MSNVLIGEFIGTMLLVLLGDGVCANVTLNNSGFKAAGPLFIALGWGLAVCLPEAAMGGTAENFPASYNPALTVALAADGSLLAGKFTIGTVIGMIIAETLNFASEFGETAKYSFVTVDSEMIHIHPLVKEILRVGLPMVKEAH